jgi:hypothetical protein
VIRVVVRVVQVVQVVVIRVVVRVVQVVQVVVIRAVGESNP